MAAMLSESKSQISFALSMLAARLLCFICLKWQLKGKNICVKICLLADASGMTGEAVRHRAFAAARANFHNQSIVANLPVLSEAKQAAAKACRRAAFAASSFSIKNFTTSDELSKPSRADPGGQRFLAS